jgi:hypothetical protein
MATFTDFARRCRMRHDFADQIQVRYQHSSDESYDTWISGEEVLARLRSADAEERLKRLGRHLPRELGATRDEAGRRLKQTLRDRLGDSVDAFAGGNPLGDSLVANVRGKEPELEETETTRWQGYLQDVAFRAVALGLAWINLRGSFPDVGSEEDGAGWV